MINNFYSSVSNGNHVETCKNLLHHTSEPLYLLKTNFLNEFRTSLEKAKVRANLGIADAETLYWKNILGDIAELPVIAEYIDSLLAIDYDTQKGFDPGENFENIQNVRQAAITCLDYLIQFQGEEAEINAINDKVKAIILNLYAVDTLDEAASSEGGVINEFSQDIRDLKSKVGNPNSTVKEIETALNKVEEDIKTINASLTDINKLIRIYVPSEEEDANALKLVEDKIDTRDGTVLKEGGLYVKDLLPLIDELKDDISGNSNDISILLEKVETNTKAIDKNTQDISDLKNTTIPNINQAILDVVTDSDNKYVSKDTLGDSPIITEDKLTDKLNGYIRINTDASVTGLTSLEESITINKPFNPITNEPLDPRHYVQTREDLKSLKAWDGMEVIVIDSALMYICTDASKSSLDTFEAWKPTDSLRIEVVSWNTFNSYKENNKLKDDIYYFIHEDQNFEVVNAPTKEQFTEDRTIYDNEGNPEHITVFNEELYNNAILEYLNSQDYLSKQYMSAAWGENFNDRLSGKADRIDIKNLNSKISDLQTKDSDLNTKILAIYNPGSEEGLLIDLTNGLDVRITDLETELGNIKTNYVTWELLGGQGDQLVQGETLFVKTSKYQEDQAALNTSLAASITTKELAATSVTTSNLTLDGTSIIKQENKISIGINNPVALESELIKEKVFDSYALYYDWVNKGTIIDGETYDLWKVGKTINDWYFVIKDNKAIPDKIEGESDETYNERVELYRSNAILSIKDAEELFATKQELNKYKLWFNQVVTLLNKLQQDLPDNEKVNVSLPT